MNTTDLSILRIFYLIIIIVLILVSGFFLIYTIFLRRPNNELFEQSINSREPTKDNEIKLYYTTWCGYSRMFMPEWERFERMAREQVPYVRVTRVNCEDSGRSICNQENVEGYPTVVLCLKNGQKIKFNDDRKAENLLAFVKKHA
jgi:thiol-disulfide isomerase/thioredoxin